jgi:hypothetical protein
MNKKPFPLFFLIIVVNLSFFGGCNRPPTLSANAKKFDFKGKVVSIDKDQGLVTIAHEGSKTICRR